MIETRVIALGQDAAGDDAVGFAVLEELRRRDLPDGVELVRAAEASALIPLLETCARVVVVDAAVGAAVPGCIVELAADDDVVLEAAAIRPVSSHGVGIAEAIGLARLLAPDRTARSIRIVAITIEQPDRFRAGLSPEVSAAVAPAADRVLAFVTASPPAIVT